MAVNMKGRHLRTLQDFSAEEIWQILTLAQQLKMEAKIGQYRPLLAGKSLAMIFQKPSLRTRVSFEVGMTQLGGHALYLAPSDIKLGERETTQDIAKVLSRMVDGIMARTFGHDIIEDLAKYSSVPVINGLSDLAHPCQILADMQTIIEKKGKLEGLKLAYVGDGNNVANSWIFSAGKMGLQLAIASPKKYTPKKEVVKIGLAESQKRGLSIEITSNPEEAVQNADIVYTDVWASMGAEAEQEQRRKDFAGFTLDLNLFQKAQENAIVLHCLPAHYGEEITKEVVDHPNSAIFDEAENRLHAQKALMALLM